MRVSERLAGLRVNDATADVIGALLVCARPRHGDVDACDFTARRDLDGGGFLRVGHARIVSLRQRHAPKPDSLALGEARADANLIAARQQAISAILAAVIRLHRLLAIKLPEGMRCV